ncbi:hypothetical protein HDU79_000594 [Rhizoclosmatium sp. JEL0117]|nr:hypothetical protein HDU79_000594 [Rhizoclosmatium sp. JEL0117]
MQHHPTEEVHVLTAFLSLIVSHAPDSTAAADSNRRHFAAHAAAVIAHASSTSASVSAEARAAFVSVLNERLAKHFHGHWHELTPARGSAYRSIAVVNGKPDRILTEAAETAGIPSLTYKKAEQPLQPAPQMHTIPGLPPTPSGGVKMSRGGSNGRRGHKSPKYYYGPAISSSVTAAEIDETQPAILGTLSPSPSPLFTQKTQTPKMPRNVLVINDCADPLSVLLPTANPYTEMLTPEERQEISIHLIATTGGIPVQDQKQAATVVELPHLKSNGQVEIEAIQILNRYKVDTIYTTVEELVRRCAGLRSLYGITSGLGRDSVECFRDKLEMKVQCEKAGFPVSKFRKVGTGADIVAFLKEFGYPAIIKPTNGISSYGVKVIKNDKDMNDYIKDMYLVENTCDEKSGGDVIIESFVNARMVHVNGFARNGVIELMWPFLYIATNLCFTTGSSYGNVLIPTSSPRYMAIKKATQHLLDSLPCPDRLIFHLELFEEPDPEAPSPVDSAIGFENAEKRRDSVNEMGPFKYSLCEIAARKPGATITELINRCETSLLPQDHPSKRMDVFSEMDFRLCLGLPLRHNRMEWSRYAKDQAERSELFGHGRGGGGFLVADLIVPLQRGKLEAVPKGEECPVPGITIRQVAKIGQVFTGYNALKVNTCARILLTLQDEEGVTERQAAERLAEAEKWYKAGVKYSSC